MESVNSNFYRSGNHILLGEGTSLSEVMYIALLQQIRVSECAYTSQ
jgi:hypothetical protein